MHIADITGEVANMVKLKLVPLRCFNYGDQQAGTVLDSLRACVCVCVCGGGS